MTSARALSARDPCRSIVSRAHSRVRSSLRGRLWTSRCARTLSPARCRTHASCRSSGRVMELVGASSQDERTGPADAGQGSGEVADGHPGTGLPAQRVDGIADIAAGQCVRDDDVEVLGDLRSAGRSRSPRLPGRWAARAAPRPWGRCSATSATDRLAARAAAQAVTRPSSSHSLAVWAPSPTSLMRSVGNAW